MVQRIELYSVTPYPCQFAGLRDEEGSDRVCFSTLVREQRDPNGELSAPGIRKNQMFGTYTSVIDVPELTADVVREHLPDLARHIERENKSKPGNLELVLIR